MGRNFWWQEDFPCDTKEFSVTGKNFLWQEGIFCVRKDFPETDRNFLWQEKISVQGETSCVRKKFPATGRNFMSQTLVEVVQYAIWIEFPVTGRNFSWEKVFCDRNQFYATRKTLQSQEEASVKQRDICSVSVFVCVDGNGGLDFLWQEDISCERKRYPVSGRSLLSMEEVYCHRKKFVATGRSLCHTEKYLQSVCVCVFGAVGCFK